MMGMVSVITRMLMTTMTRCPIPRMRPLDASESVDTDGDGVGDNSDAFPENPAASTDTDGDGAPDAWNESATEEQIANSELTLDAHSLA